MNIYNYILFLITISMGEGYRLLAILPFTAKSHQLYNNGILKILADAGHNLTVIAPYTFWDKIPPNVEYIQFNSTLISLPKTRFFKMNSMKFYEVILQVWSYAEDMCEVSLGEPGLKPFMKAKGIYDALLLEAFSNECFMGFSHALEIPIIQMVSYMGSTWVTDSVGVPTPYAYVYEPYMFLEHNMQFIDRLLNTIYGVGIKIARNWIYLPKLDEMMRRHFDDPKMPWLGDIEKRTSLLLVNNHESISYAKPGMPNMVNVAGMHIESSKPLPTHIQQFMDNAKHGVVFFSMGSILQMKDMDPKKRDAIVKVLSSLKQRVIMRWDEDLPIPNEPKNILFISWVPQYDILGHASLMVFATHGGLLSSIEAIDRGIPVLGFPIFVDQVLNMRRYQAKGLGILIEYSNISISSLEWGFNEIFKPSYKEAAKRHSKIYHDRENHPKKSVVWWVEYIIRHEGAKHMRSPGLDLNWFQYYLLDVIFFLSLISILIYLSVKSILKYIIPKSHISIKFKKY